MPSFVDNLQWCTQSASRADNELSTSVYENLKGTVQAVGMVARFPLGGGVSRHRGAEARTR